MKLLTPEQLADIQKRQRIVDSGFTNSSQSNSDRKSLLDHITLLESLLAEVDAQLLTSRKHHIVETTRANKAEAEVSKLEGELTETKRMLVNETETLNELVDGSEILESSLHKAEAEVSKLRGHARHYGRCTTLVNQCTCGLDKLLEESK